MRIAAHSADAVITAKSFDKRLARLLATWRKRIAAKMANHNRHF
jgi:hypothetical protein